MNGTKLVLLAGLTACAVVMAFLVPKNAARESGAEPGPFIPGLEQQVNGIDWLQVSAAGEAVATIHRGADGWVVDEASGYHADWPRVQSLLATLAHARVLEAKTSNPAYYDRLGVQGPDAAEPSGLLIAFAEATGLPAVIAGNRPQGRDGQYARLAGKAQSVLIDAELDLPRETVGWLDRMIVDVAESEVLEVSVTHPDGETVVAKKSAVNEQNLELQDIPEGFGLKSAWTVNALAGGFSSLELEEVAPASGIDWSGAIRYRVITADGLHLEARLVEPAVEEEGHGPYWLSLEAGLYTTAVGSEIDSSAAQERARAISRRVSGWAYRVAEYRYDSMTRRLDHFMEKAGAGQ